MWGQLRPVQAASAPSTPASGGADINISSPQQQQNQTAATETAASKPAAPAPAAVASASSKDAADTDTSAVPLSAASSADLLANATARSIVGAGTIASEHISSSSKSRSEKADPPNDDTCSTDNDNGNGPVEGHANSDANAADEWGFDDDPFFNDHGGQGDDIHVNTTDAVDSTKNSDKSPQMQTRSEKTAGVESVPKNNDDEEEVDDLIPPSSTMLIKTNRRLGASSSGTRSAIAANKKHKSSMQPDAKPNSKDNEAAIMELAQRKFAAAVRKIEDDDDADAGGDDEADDAAAETAAEGSNSILYEKLVQYISSLSSTDTPLVRSLNSLLEAELFVEDGYGYGLGVIIYDI